MKLRNKIITSVACVAVISGLVYGGMKFLNKTNTDIENSTSKPVVENSIDVATETDISTEEVVSDVDSTENEIVNNTTESNTTTEEITDTTEFTSISKPATTTEQSTSGTIATTEQPAPAATTTQQAQNTAPSNTTTQNTQPAPSAPQAPVTPVHEHNWQWVVDKAAYDETVVTKEAWTETIVHEAEVEYVVGVQCNGCGAKFTSMDALGNHQPCGGRAYGTCYVEVPISDAWTETVYHPAETTIKHHDAEGHYQCSCGATK